MKDQLLALAVSKNVDTGNTTNVVDLTGFGGLITFISDAIPLSTAIASCTERMALEVVCASTFADACNVDVDLISYSSGDLTAVGTAVILGGYSTHWRAPRIPNTAFVTGRRMFTVPLPPSREYQQYLMLMMRFSAETSGRITAHITPFTNMVQYPPANAI